MMEEVISPPPKGKEGEPPSREVPLFPPSSSSTFSHQQHGIPSAGSFRQPSSIPMYPVVNETIAQPGREKPSGSVKAKEDEEQKTRNDILEYERIMKLQASQIRSDLSYACIIPAILLISIAGKPGLISLSFGGVATYLLDLLESVEGSLIALSLTFLAFTACVIWGMRELLTSSLSNILVFLVMGASILFIFLTSICQYNVVLFDVGVFNTIMLQVMFASMPLLFSALIAGIVAVEVPEFDIITCFSVSYFVYTYLLCRPRLLWRGGVVQHGFRITRERRAQAKPLLPDALLRAILVIPVLISVAVHVAIHRRLPMTDDHRWFHFAYALLLPRFLMSFCVFDHKERVVDDVRAYHAGEDFFSTVTILALGHFLPSHPIFDELKTFCVAQEPVPSRVLNMMGTMIAAAILTQRRLRELRTMVKLGGNGTTDDLGMANRRTAPALSPGFGYRLQFGFFKLLMDILIAVTTIFACFLLNLDPAVLPITIFGGVALNELYHKDDWNLASLFMLAMVGFLTTTIVFRAFADSTVAPLQYVLTGLYDLSLYDFSQVAGVLLTIAAIAPSLISLVDKDTLQELLLPSSASASRRAGESPLRMLTSELVQWAHYLYSIVFVVLTLVTVFLELLILDQHWESIELSSALVYPSEYAIATAAFLLVTAFACYRAGIIGLYAIVTVGVANGLKMLYFYDVDPATIYATIFVVLAAMYPLFDQLQLSLQFAKEMDQLEYNAHAYEEAKEQFRTPWQHQIASTLGLLVILFSPLGRHISRTVLERVLTGGDTAMTNVALWQELVFSAAIWTAYVATLLYVFYPNMQLLRNASMAVAMVLTLIACGGFGLLVVDTDTGYIHPMDTSHSFLMRGHGEFYLMLSGVLTVATMTQYVALDSWIACVAYSLLFGFVSTKALIDWAFPLTLQSTRSMHTYRMGAGPPQPLDLFVNRDLHYPFYFLFLVKTLWTMTALYSRRDRASTWTFAISYTSGLLVPIVALVVELWQMAHDMDHVLAREVHTSRMVGIVWSTLLGMITLAGSIRGREILYLLDGGLSLQAHQNDHYNSSSSSSSSAASRSRSAAKRAYATRSWELTVAKFVKFYYAPPSSMDSTPTTAATAAAGWSSKVPEHVTPCPGSYGYLSAMTWVLFAGLLWTGIALYFQTTALDADVLFPGVLLLLLLAMDTTSLSWWGGWMQQPRPTAMDVWAACVSLWWYASLFYHVFVLHYDVRHLGVEALTIEMQHRRVMMPYSVFGWDSNISWWSNASCFVPLLNLLLALIPLPGLLVVLSPRLVQQAHEDVLFILGVVNLAALIGAAVDCVRYLAVLSAVLCVYRSYALVAQAQRTNPNSGSNNSFTAAMATAATSFGGSVGPRLMQQRDRYL